MLVGEGESLYIPAGWAHQVTSMTAAAAAAALAGDSAAAGGGGGGGGDLSVNLTIAINMWWAPV